MKPLFKKNYFVLLVTTLTLISFSITFAEEPPPKKYELKDAIHILQILAGGMEAPDPEPEPEGVIGFETVGQDWKWNVFENGDNPPPLEIVVNPDRSGENTSPYVAKFTAKKNGAEWAGTETFGFEPFTLDESNATVTIFVYKPVISRVCLKLVFPSGEGLGTVAELFTENTKTNEWEKLSVSFKDKINAATDKITGLVIYPDRDPRNADNVCLFDNISFSDDPVIENVIKSELIRSVEHAENLANGTGIGTSNGQVSQETADTLRTKINDAKVVMNNPAATQMEVDSAVVILEAAILDFQNAIIGDIGDDNGDGLIYLYTADDSLIDLDFNEDYQSVNDWGSGSTLDKEYSEDSVYQPVIMVTPGIGSWGDSSNGCVAFSQFSPGFASTYQSLHFKYKGGTLVKLKFPGTKNQEVTYDVNSATQLEDGWFEFTIPLSNHEDYQTASEFGIFNHNIEDPFFITDIYFTPPTESK
jgi:hypothetical protein